jgi:hypothetical protein
MTMTNTRHTFYRTRPAVTILVLALLALLAAACAGSNSAEAPALSRSEAVAEDVYMAEEAMPAEAPMEYADGASVPIENFLAAAVQAQESRVIIYTGDISLVVKDTEAAINEITQLVTEQGGYMSGSNVYQSSGVLRGSVSIRVPAERYQPVMEGLRTISVRVERESSSTQDVTEEFTDLQARKVNLERTEAALQTLLEERQRVGKTSDILDVYRELTDIRGQIEQIEGRMRYLSNQAALSTINIELIPDVLNQPVSVGSWEPQGVAKEALQALVSALQGLIDLAIWLTIFLLPLAVIFLLPVLAVVLVVRIWWRRRKTSKPAAKKTDAEK